MTQNHPFFAFALGTALLLAGTAEAAQKDRFDRLDRNKDGTVDRQELSALQAQRFKRLDADKNGFLTPAEVPAEERKATPSPQRSDAGPVLAPLPGAAGEKAGKAGDKPARGLVRRLDGDKDGRLSPAEYAVLSERMLRRLDANKDGRLTREEMQPRRKG